MIQIIALLALLAAFPALSTDMYLAAIPLLVNEWQQPLVIVNLTLVGFFITYCGFLLIYGPLSDRYGRRPPLLVGLIIFVIASLLCSMADDVFTMIVARVMQGAGAASASAICFAICRDLFDGNMRQRVFVQLGIIVAAAPMLGPLIGSWIIDHIGWNWVFVVQAVMGTIAFLGVWRLPESLQEKSTEKLRRVMLSYVRLARNPRFFLLNLAFSVLGIPIFAFIAVSSNIYITTYGFSEQVYGYFFALNASAFMAAPLLFSRVSRSKPLARLLPLSYTVLLLASLLMLLPLPDPYRLAVPMWLVTFAFAFGRPPGNNLLLEQVEQDIGAASSLMVFLYFLTGAMAMWFISLDWQDTVRVLGILGTCSATLTLTAWIVINRVFKLKMVS
ncbi:multidrug effflux MFS transporter [Desulfosediminicola sp.]|uniref:multidrug effflux MFS transporter n=1 Tax=Desulfosediminicola sp. TaxID=2886825 RepID=UPI003AF20C60